MPVIIIFPECEGLGGDADTCWETAFRKEELGLKWEPEEEMRQEEKDSGERNLFDVRTNCKPVWAIRGGEVFTYRRFNIL